MKDEAGRMSGDEARPDETTQLAEITVLARRAGLRLSAAELAGLAEGYYRTQDALRALRADLDSTEEPATTFNPS